MNLLTIYTGKTGKTNLRGWFSSIYNRSLCTLQFTFTSNVRDTENDEVQRTWPKH